MATITTDPSPYLVNIFPFPNVITSATGNSSGSGAAAAEAVASLQTYLNPTTASLAINTVSAYSGSNVTYFNNLLLSNAALYIGTTSVWNATNLGVGTTNPLETLDVAGTALIRSTLSVSSSIYASGTVYAQNVVYPSDGRLKRDVVPYRNERHVEPVRFTWAKTGSPDIGVIAQDVWAVEPACVHSTSSGVLGVDYAKLVVVCLAELRDLRSTVHGLQSAAFIPPPHCPIHCYH